jgi:GTP-binding protein EngB required for normal cell division
MEKHREKYQDGHPYCHENQLHWMVVKQNKRKSSYPYAVLLGGVGTGKTSFLNKIANEKLLTASGGKSLTKNVQVRNASYGNGFKVSDTPGTGAMDDKLKHAVALCATLTLHKVSGILICVKAGRHEEIKQNVEDQFIRVENYSDKIIVIITHFDTIKEIDKPNSQFEEICVMMDDYFGIKSVIAVGKDADSEKLCQAIRIQLDGQEPIKLNYDSDDIVKNFDVIEKSNFKMKQEGNQRKQKFEEKMVAVIKSVEKNLKSMTTTQEKDELLHQVGVYVKREADNLADQFSNDFSGIMDQIECYSAYMRFKRILKPAVKKVLGYLNENMSFDLSNKSDIRNQIRLCPYCGEVWIKVSGCDGTTTCGKRALDTLEVEKDKPWLSFCFEYVGNMFTWTKNSTKKSVKTVSYKENQKGKGCGKQIVWSEMPLLSEDQLKIIKEIGLTDYEANTKKESEQVSFDKKVMDELGKVDIDEK